MAKFLVEVLTEAQTHAEAIHLNGVGTKEKPLFGSRQVFDSEEEARTAYAASGKDYDAEVAAGKQFDAATVHLTKHQLAIILQSLGEGTYWLGRNENIEPASDPAFMGMIENAMAAAAKYSRGEAV